MMLKRFYYRSMLGDNQIQSSIFPISDASSFESFGSRGLSKSNTDDSDASVPTLISSSLTRVLLWRRFDTAMSVLSASKAFMSKSSLYKKRMLQNSLVFSFVVDSLRAMIPKLISVQHECIDDLREIIIALMLRCSKASFCQRL